MPTWESAEEKLINTDNAEARCGPAAGFYFRWLLARVAHFLHPACGRWCRPEIEHPVYGRPSPTYPGIRLRISIPAGVLMDLDSTWLHYVAKIQQLTGCDLMCPPQCARHGWYELIPGHDAPLLGINNLTIEVMPVELAARGDVES